MANEGSYYVLVPSEGPREIIDASETGAAEKLKKSIKDHTHPVSGLRSVDVTRFNSEAELKAFMQSGQDNKRWLRFQPNTSAKGLEVGLETLEKKDIWETNFSQNVESILKQRREPAPGASKLTPAIIERQEQAPEILNDKTGTGGYSAKRVEPGR